MGLKNIGIKEDVYERLKAHKRGNESFSETIDRLLHELDSDWRTNVGFLTGKEAAALETEVDRGLASVNHSYDELGKTVDDFDVEE